MVEEDVDDLPAEDADDIPLELIGVGVELGPGLGPGLGLESNSS